MGEPCVLAPSGAIHAVMKISVKVGHFLEEMGHVNGVPHKTSGRIFNGEKDSVLNTAAAELLSTSIQ